MKKKRKNFFQKKRMIILLKKPYRVTFGQWKLGCQIGGYVLLVENYFNALCCNLFHLWPSEGLKMAQ